MFKKLGVILMSTLLMFNVLAAQNSKSTELTRDKIPEKYKWDLSQMFKTPQAWE